MKGDKITFSEGSTFYKEYSDHEFRFLKMLHGSTWLEIDTTIKDNKYFITMPKGNVISIDTIPKKKVSLIQSIIIENIPFMLQQIHLLESLNIYYSDCLQWLYHDNRLYLIDFDTAYIGVDTDHSNYDLLHNFFTYFELDYSFIAESLDMLNLFKEGIYALEFFNLHPEKITLYNKLNDPAMVKNHVYYTKNQRHVQLKHHKYIHVYGNTGNIVITENIINPEIAKDWELVRIA